MKNVFAGRASYFILTFLFAVIIASFLFTGIDGFNSGLGMGGGASNVATVDGTPITSREYQMALQRQVEFFNQMMGENGLTQKQLEEMGIKQNVLNQLIQQKLIQNTADQMGFVVSIEEVKNEIRNLPYFQTNGRFDVNLYKNALQNNGYTPAQFEQLITSDLKQKKVDEIFGSLLVAENSVKDIKRFKANKVVLEGFKVSRQALAPLISVSEAEVKAYLADEKNKKTLEEAYEDNISEYNRPEEVKARHILVETEKEAKAIRSEVNAKNFASIASKKTQDPTGKDNGGELGWFSTGRMVPEFEKVAFSMKKGEISAPVKTQFGYHIILVEDKKAAEIKTLENVQGELARLLIQKTKAQDLDELLRKTSNDVETALAKNDLGSIEKLAKKVSGDFFKDTAVNQYEQKLSNSVLSPSESEKIFSAAPGTVLNLGNPGMIYVVKIKSKDSSAKEMNPTELKAELGSQNQLFARKVREDLLRSMSNKAKVVTNNSLL